MTTQQLEKLAEEAREAIWYGEEGQRRTILKCLAALLDHEATKAAITARLRPDLVPLISNRPPARTSSEPAFNNE